MLDIKDLSITFKSSDSVVEAVKKLSFSVEEGSFFGIAGESGSGKTQSMMSILGLLEPNATVSGSILRTHLLLLSNT